MVRQASRTAAEASAGAEGRPPLRQCFTTRLWEWQKMKRNKTQKAPGSRVNKGLLGPVGLRRQDSNL